MTDKQTLLQNICQDLNREDQPWKIEVQNEQIIVTWKWMDATFFSPTGVTDDVRSYKLVITLLDNGEWTEKDVTNENNAGLSLSKKGLFFGASSSSGTRWQKTIVIGFGKDHNTGKTGIIKNSFNTETVKKPIRRYLEKEGWRKKKGFWEHLFK